MKRQAVGVSVCKQTRNGVRKSVSESKRIFHAEHAENTKIKREAIIRG